MLEPAVFKAYDIRGTYPDQIDEDGAYAIGRAYAQWLEPKRIAVGRDMRTMAPSIAEALIRGLTDSAVDVMDIGMVGTEMLYLAVAQHDLDGGIQVTASHNPREYIGMKIVRRGSLPVGGDSGLADVCSVALAGQWTDRGPAGSAEQVDIWGEFTAKIMSFVDPGRIRPLTVVIDAGNGLGGRMVEGVLSQLPGLAIHAYNVKPDGTFPNHEPNPLLPENRAFIMSKVLEHGADIGIAWDGDADRCFFIDDHGEFVPGDFITAVIARAVLDRHPGSKILYDIRSSRAVADTVTASGGTPIASRVGHAFIKQRMRVEDAAFAGEVSGHYYFRDFFSVDTGLVPAVVMLQLVSESGGSLSDLIAPFHDRYFLSGEINTPVNDVPMKLQQIKERYADATISHVDGVSIDYDDWHFNVRPSNTEPLLRLCLEATTQEAMERRRDEVLDLIRSDSTARMGSHA